MKKWKVIMVCGDKLAEITIEAQYYSDAYLEAGKRHPGCVIKSIAEIKN